MTAADADMECAGPGRGPARRRILPSASSDDEHERGFLAMPASGSSSSPCPPPQLPSPLTCSNKPGFRVLILGILMLLSIGGTQAFRVAAALRSLTKGPHPYLEASSPVRILSHRLGSVSSSRQCGFVTAALKGQQGLPSASAPAPVSARPLSSSPLHAMAQPRERAAAERGGEGQQEQRQQDQGQGQGQQQQQQQQKQQQKARGEWAEGNRSEDEGEEDEADAAGRRRGGRQQAGVAGVIPTEEELEAIVAQRGQELARMNGAASHLALAHSIWGQVLRPGSVVVDATCGNGHDALAIAKFLFPTGVSERLLGQLHCIDIQETAIESTRRQLLEKAGAPLNADPATVSDTFRRHVHFHQQNFREFPAALPPESVALLVYNLGYLPGPGQDKRRTTMTADTLESLRQALFIRPVLAVQGLVSIMCYRGHPEGAKEAAAVQDFVEGLDPEVWRCFIHAPLNRPLSPALITIYRLK